MTDQTDREARILHAVQAVLPKASAYGVPSPEESRFLFMRLAGSELLANAETPSHAELDLTRIDQHVLGVTVWVRDRAELNRLQSCVNLDLHARIEDGAVAFHFGGRPSSPRKQSDDAWDAAARMVFREPGSGASREGRLDPEAVVACLAVFFLSKRGGGTRTVNGAADLLHAETRVDPRGYIGGGEWPSTYYRLVRRLEHRLGPMGDS